MSTENRRLMMPPVDSSSTKKSTALTLIDKLSRLSYQQTLKLLGSDAPRLLRAGDKWDFRLEEDVYLGPDLFRLKFPPAAGERESERVIVMISLVETSYNRLQWRCTACESLCEHIGAAQLTRPYTRKTVGIHVQYRDRAALRLLLPEKLDSKTREMLEDLRGRDIDDVSDLLRRIQGLERQGRSVNIYPDAEELIHRRLLLERIARRVAEIRIEPESHRLRRGLLKAELLPYQLDGIAFAAGAGRAVLADEMGL